jgi:hypothetical protein
MLLTSLWWNKKTNRLLLIVTNYETEPMDDVEVKLDLAKLGLKGKLHAEDAVTMEPVMISDEGILRLDILAERYRLIRISNEPPRFRDELLGRNLVTGAPAQITANWTSAEVQLEPNSTYVVKALVKIDKNLGEGSSTPNRDMFQLPNYVTLGLSGEGVNGVNGTNKLALCAIKGTDQMLPYPETDNYKRACRPQLWEKTPGWAMVFVPVGTATNTTKGNVEVRFSESVGGGAVLKDVTLQKVR